MIKKRIKWAKDNKECDWDSTMWTNECSISTTKPPGWLMVTWKPGEEYLPECVASSFHSGRDSIAVWACIANNAKGLLIWLKTTAYMVSKSGRETGGGLTS